MALLPVIFGLAVGFFAYGRRDRRAEAAPEPEAAEPEVPNNTPQLPPEIWAIILRHVMDECPDGFARQKARLFQLGPVSKAFSTACDDHSGHILALSSVFRARALLRELSARGDMAQNITELWLCCNAYEIAQRYAREVKEVNFVLHRLTAVTTLHYRWTPIADPDRQPRITDIALVQVMSGLPERNFNAQPSPPFIRILRKITVAQMGNHTGRQNPQAWKTRISLPDFPALCPELEVFELAGGEHHFENPNQVTRRPSLAIGGPLHVRGKKLRKLALHVLSLPWPDGERAFYRDFINPDDLPNQLFDLTLHGPSVSSFGNHPMIAPDLLVNNSRSLAVAHLELPADTTRIGQSSKLLKLSATTTKIGDVELAANAFALCSDLQVLDVGALLPASQGQLIQLLNRLPCRTLVVTKDARWSTRRIEDLEAVCGQAGMELRWRKVETD